VLIGHSLGAAIALQAAADNARVSAVVAAETFSDLATVARERAPFVFTDAAIREAFRIAEERGRFRVDEASPLRAAERIRVPVLLLHGEADTETPLAHSRRVFEALQCPKRLALLPGVRHAGSLNASTWPQIEAWIDEVLPAIAAPAR
jgi:dipeptidyl aminopeptidase/acylaminoacyl peptidase